MTTSPNPTPTSQILDAAADLVVFHGWWQSGGELDGSMPVCAANAIFNLRDTMAVRSVVAAQLTFARYIGGASLGDIWTWNDAPDRTAEQVVAALRACALLEAAREEGATQAPAGRHEVAL